MISQSPRTRTPADMYKKNEAWPTATSYYGNSQDPVAKRQFAVDTLRVNKEKKLLFNKVDYEPDTFFQFGAPGAGAPLRNPQNNEPVSRLPNINENLWKRYANESPTQQQSEQMRAKKQEMLRMIDDFSNRNGQTRYYDPVTRTHIKPENYWNDWFGRPGGGAPNIPWNMHKQNLNKMLEPRAQQMAQQNSTSNIFPPLPYNPAHLARGAGQDLKRSQSINDNRYYDPSDPNCLKFNSNQTMFGANHRPFRSNHHNNYEVHPS